MTEEERHELAITISSHRILTQREFEQLKVLETKKRCTRSKTKSFRTINTK